MRTFCKKRSPSSLRSYGLCRFPEGLFDVFVSQAIDERVEQWVDQCVEQGSHFVSLQGVGGARPWVHEEQGSIEERDWDQVWGTGEEGLAPSWSRVDPQNSEKDAEIGNDDDKNAQEDLWNPRDPGGPAHRPWCLYMTSSPVAVHHRRSGRWYFCHRNSGEKCWQYGLWHSRSLLYRSQQQVWYRENET